MNIQEFEKNVHMWSTIRGIYDHLTWESQLKLYYQESIECLEAETREEKLLEYGDRIVCLINCIKMFPKAPIGYRVDFEIMITNVIFELINDGFGDGDVYQKTWDKIKDRKGMIAGDKWVKWKDLTEAQREEYTEREKQFL